MNTIAELYSLYQKYKSEINRDIDRFYTDTAYFLEGVGYMEVEEREAQYDSFCENSVNFVDALQHDYADIGQCINNIISNDEEFQWLEMLFTDNARAIDWVVDKDYSTQSLKKDIEEAFESLVS